MKRHFYPLLISFFYIFLHFHAQAENTLGGTLDFTHKGGDNFNVKVTIYVDKTVNGTSPNLYTGIIPAPVVAAGSAVSFEVRDMAGPTTWRDDALSAQRVSSG